MPARAQSPRGANRPPARWLAFPRSPNAPGTGPASRFRVALGLVLALLAAAPTHAAADYLREIKPLLRSRCYGCHGALKQKAGLRVDTVESMLRGGKDGPAFKRGEPDASPLVRRVAEKDIAERMPPEHEGEALSADQIALLRGWIAAGAPAPGDEKPEADPKDHWAFRPPVRPAVPAVANAAWVRNPIDSFLSRRHAQLGLTPQPEASPLVQLRRLYLDLVGLPPSPAEIRAFERDPAPDRYERTAARLLADPRHGERWARHWMDIWRYSDWWGLGQELRASQKHIWHWRDWIVESLNAGTPYDEMVRLMLAADESHPGEPDKLRATGFLARQYFLFNRDHWMEETVEHVGKGFLGLSLNCAKCHDHKYDPIAQKDFYRMRAFFEPYQVRMDMVPGELDLVRDGIPRAFDAKLDTPTYRYVRGVETNPDKSEPMLPGVPALLAFKEPSIRPVVLPAGSWQPERHPWFFEAHRDIARRNLAAARDGLAAAQARLAEARRDETTAQAARSAAPASPPAAAVAPEIVPPLFSEKFASLDDTRWKPFGGRWNPAPGGVQQEKIGQSLSALRWLGKAPRDFDAAVRFTILGGDLYRSVGISFDATAADAIQQGPGDTEILVYASAHGPGPKVQAARGQAGRYDYPAEGARPHRIESNREHTLRVQARGTLLNAAVDGQPVLAMRVPWERRDGALQLTAFDAHVVFHEFTLRPLPASVPLRASDSEPATISAVARAEGDRRLAERALEVAEAEQTSLDRRIEAMRAGFAVVDAGGATNHPALATHERERSQAAIRAELDVKRAMASQALAAAEIRHDRSVPGQKEAAAKDVKAARETLAAAEKALGSPIGPEQTYTRLAASKWTTTRFAHPDHDDPPVAFPARSTGRRTALADWITDPRNPLAARVAANHIWARHMGSPLAGPVFEFGRKGQAPTHPELLDWLASELVASGWDMKHLHHLIVTSAAYRMSSSLAGADANLARDPDNHGWWRRLPIRLEAEVVRDCILSVAGNLDPTRGGPPVAPEAQAGSRRRSLYFFHSNNERNLFLTTFDAAGVNECYQRDQSIVPQQALALSNSALVQDSAALIAARLGRDGVGDPEFIRDAFVAVLGVPPTPAQIAASTRAMEAWRALPEPGPGPSAAGAARTHLSWALLNHNDFVTLR